MRFQPLAVQRILRYFLWLIPVFILAACDSEALPTPTLALPTFGPTPPAPPTRVTADPGATTTALAAATATADVAPGAPASELAWQSLSAPGHTARINAVTTTPDGSISISASDDSTIRLWDFAKQNLIGVLHGHSAPVTALALAPDGKTFASGGADRTIIFWDIASRKESGRISGLPGPVDQMAFAPDGKTIAGAFSPADKTGDLDRDNPASVILWDVATHKESGTAFTLSYVRSQVRGAVTSLAYAPDGKTLAVTATNAPVALWDVATKKARQIFQARLDGTTAAAFSPDSKTLAVGDTDSNGRPLLRLYNAQDGKAKAVLPDTSAAAITNGATAVAFSPDGRYIAVGWDGLSTTIWSLATNTVYGHLRPSLRSSPTPAAAFAFDTKGRLVSGGDDVTLRQWDVANLKQLAFFRGGSFGATGVTFSPDGKKVAALSWLGADGQVLPGRVVGLWDTVSGSEIAILSQSPAAPATPQTAPPPAQHAPLTAAWMPDSQTLVVAQDNGLILLWNVSGNPQIVGQLVDNVAQAPTSHIAISRDGHYLAAGYRGNSIVVWDIAAQRIVTRIKGRKTDDSINAVAFLPPQKTVAQTASPAQTPVPEAAIVVSLSAQGALDLWNVQNGDRLGGTDLKTFNATIMAVSADGAHISIAAPDATTGPLLQYDTAKLYGQGATGPAPTPTMEPTLPVITPTLTPGKGTPTARPTHTPKPTSTPKPTPTATPAPASTIAPPTTPAPTATHNPNVTPSDTPLPALPALLEGNIAALAYAPDSAYLAIATGLTQVAIWSVTGNKAVLLFPTSGGRVTELAWSPDGRFVATTQEDGSIRMWRVRPPRL